MIRGFQRHINNNPDGLLRFHRCTTVVALSCHTGEKYVRDHYRQVEEIPLCRRFLNLVRRERCPAKRTSHRNFRGLNVAKKKKKRYPKRKSSSRVGHRFICSKNESCKNNFFRTAFGSIVVENRLAGRTGTKTSKSRCDRPPKTRNFAEYHGFDADRATVFRVENHLDHCYYYPKYDYNCRGRADKLRGGVGGGGGGAITDFLIKTRRRRHSSMYK